MQPHILIVDDEESIRYTFESFLAEEGYTVFSAADCDQGVALPRPKRYRLAESGHRDRTRRAGSHDHRRSQC